MNESKIALRNVEMRFGDVVALDSTSLQIAAASNDGPNRSERLWQIHDSAANHRIANANVWDNRI